MQLAENARRWGHEKIDLMSKIQEIELQQISPSRKPQKVTNGPVQYNMYLMDYLIANFL
jgi:hypothetical protein